MTAAKMKVKKGDQVVILTGKDKGARGEVLGVLLDEQRVVVQGVNVATRHVKPTQASPEGGIRKEEKSIHVSNVALIDPKSDKPTKAGFKVEKDGTKVRVARKSGTRIDGKEFKKSKG